MGCTATFEYVGRQSRIKARHEGAARLVLIAVRQKVSGEYWEHDGLVQLGRRHGVEVVRRVIMPTTGEQGHVSVWEVERLVKEVGGETEGVMARLHGGALLKLKTGWWLQRQPVQGWRRQKEQHVVAPLAKSRCNSCNSPLLLSVSFILWLSLSLSLSLTHSLTLVGWGRRK